MNKGIIDLIPAAVEAIKQETVKKMKLFSSDGKADGIHVSSVAAKGQMDEQEMAALIAAEVRKVLNSRK